jgi:hypothetical protein
MECDLISGKQAKRFLKQPRLGCRQPYLVLVTACSEASQQREQPSSRLTTLLNSYADVFKPPTEGLEDDLAPPSVTVEPAAEPPNRPAFRLSRVDREKLEAQVLVMLVKGQDATVQFSLWSSGVFFNLSQMAQCVCALTIVR